MQNEQTPRQTLEAVLVTALIERATTAALKQLVPAALCHTEKGSVIGRFLLALDDGAGHPFNLNDLRRLEHVQLDACLQILAVDHAGRLNVRQRVILLKK
ncbi:hypothetical protein KX841_22560 [Pseudomonas aeruginosa]|uniref:DUF7673 family protein n=2 Tax=Pseudomonas aeruginosa TaxID=287 RepID=UPI001C531BA9|nr:hypothetical protein [Pseudomonas aeruginosa]MBW0921863.1 hypothetical protein [Pseudomonas aeruginosa]